MFYTYHCNNCGNFLKEFAIVAVRHAERWYGAKIGELPAFGPPTPAKLVSLLGTNGPIFLKGRQCEIHGQGIGAYAYYRRIVELTKDEILELIRETAQLEPEKYADLMADLEAAQKETRFKDAINLIKHALPPSLLIQNQNPLTVLHDCLSQGIHQLDDATCLDRATAVRLVLIALVERVSELKKTNTELSSAVAKIGKRIGV